MVSSFNLTDLEDVFKALANSKRLEALLLILSSGEMSLQEISDHLEIPLKTASRNMMILKKAGFLHGKTKDGKLVYEINTASNEDYILTLLVLVKDAAPQ